MTEENNTKQPLFILSPNKRASGESFYIFSDAVTEEYKTLFFNAGFDIKDFHFDTAHRMEQTIRESLKGQTIEELFKAWEDDGTEYELSEADIYPHELIKWIQNDSDALSYCDEVLSEYMPKTFFEIMELAQSKAMQDLFYKLKPIFLKYYGGTQ